MDIVLINRKLRENYGQDWLGQSYYRLVWSDDEIEKRFSYFEDYVEGTNVLIRRVQEVREVKKYSFINPPCYILEKLFFNQHNTEILDNSTLNPSRNTYEPLWVFNRDKKGRPIKPIWRAIELLIHWHLNPKKLTPSEMNDLEYERALEDEQIMLDLINEHIPNDSLHMAIKDGGAVMLNQDKKK